MFASFGIQIKIPSIEKKIALRRDDSKGTSSIESLDSIPHNLHRNEIKT